MPGTSSAGPDDVAEDGARLDRGQLPGVADQHEPGLRPHRLHQPRHERERDHRGLVDDDDVVGQAVAAVVAEAAVAVGAPAEEPVQRRRLGGEELRADGVADVEPGGLLVHGLLQAGGRLARRRREGDERLGVARRRGLLGQESDDPRDGRRLAGAGAPGDDGEAMLHGGRARLALALVVHVGEEPGQPLGEGLLVDVVGGRGAEGLQVGGDLALLAPVAVEVQRGADQSQRSALGLVLAERDEPAPLKPFDPFADGRPGERGEVDRLVGVDGRGLADGGEVDVDVPEPGTAHGERARRARPARRRPSRAAPAAARRGRRPHRGRRPR